jgi:hypothetical protein
VIAFVMAVAAIPCWADSSPAPGRDEAIQRINECSRSDVSRRECTHLNNDIETLVVIYRKGDKSVLPVLFRFPWLTNFYGEALLSDPNGFLSALTQLPKQDQKTVVAGISGGMLGLNNKERFKALRVLLAGIPDSSQFREIAMHHFLLPIFRPKYSRGKLPIL